MKQRDKFFVVESTYIYIHYRKNSFQKKEEESFRLKESGYHRGQSIRQSRGECAERFPGEVFLFEGIPGRYGGSVPLARREGRGGANFHSGEIYPEVSEHRRVGGKDHK